jgi:hypothetical protein
MALSYLPTSYFFDTNKWSNQFKNQNDQHLYQAGLMIGQALRKTDDEFSALIANNHSFSEKEIIVLLQFHTFELFANLETSGLIDKANIILESIHDAVQLIMKTARNKNTSYKPMEVYESALGLATRRIYLESQWHKIFYSKWQLKAHDQHWQLVSCKNDRDLGEKMAVYRFQDHLNQIMHGTADKGGVKDNNIRFIPTKIITRQGQLGIQYDKPTQQTYLLNYNLLSQHPFYLIPLISKPFKQFNLLTLKTLRYFWIIFQALSLSLLNAYKDGSLSYATSYFSKQELKDILNKCLTFSDQHNDQLIDLFSNNQKMMADFWLNPLYQLDDQYWILLAPFLTGQFHRVIDDKLKNQVFVTEQNRKGKLFEINFAQMLQAQINKNTILQQGFCHIVKVGYKQLKGKKNEEIDIILRIGKTYLLIEAKSFVYRVGSEGYHNNMTTLVDSNIQQKRDFFIEDYEHFKSCHDHTADFELKPERVLSCYLSSVPHAVGTKVNSVPVVDSSLLERYFGNGNFQIIDLEQKTHIFPFYKTFEQAEENLSRYLSELPQLHKYQANLKYTTKDIGINFDNKKVLIDEAYIDLSLENEIKSAQWLLTMKDNWHKA